tara:strand:+ start:3002 stop:3427 length:426 start_codon:yes stop_codon:yes gene_type:complete
MKKYLIGILLVLFIVACGPVQHADDHDDGDDHVDESDTGSSTDTTTSDDSAASTDAATEATAASEGEVRLTDKVAEPDSITVSVGSTVTFVNTADRIRQVTGDVRTGQINAGERAEYTFEEAGTYNYVVIPLKYRGTVIVE